MNKIKNKKEKPKISIIIPVYNSGNTIERCVDSILKQTYDNFEVILINDGSTDESGDICSMFAKENNKINAFHQDNLGVSAARNYGIDKAKGQWIAFWDSDDTATPDYIEYLASGIVENNCLVMQGLQYFHLKNNKSEIINFERQVVHISKLGLLIKEINLFDYGYPFGKLYNRDVIESNNLRFNSNISLCEDLLFMTQYLELCKSLSIIDKANYIYHKQDSGSLSTKINSFESEFEMFKRYSAVLDWNADRWETGKESDIRKASSIYLYRGIVSMFMNGTKKNRSERLDRLRYIYKNHYAEFINNKPRIPILKLIYFCIKHKLLFTLDTLLAIKYRITK